jgi:thioredoxin-like negative regulator of GroEL
MSVLHEALEFLGLAAGSGAPNDQCELRMARTRQEQRELTERMRQLPASFGDRLSIRTLATVRRSAAAGQWEKAVDKLITALHARGEAVSVEEREELLAVLRALDMPRERADGLSGR